MAEEGKPPFLSDRWLDENFPLVNRALDMATENPMMLLNRLMPESMHPVSGRRFERHVTQPNARVRRTFEDIGYGGFQPFPVGTDYDALVARARKQAGY